MLDDLDAYPDEMLDAIVERIGLAEEYARASESARVRTPGSRYELLRGRAHPHEGSVARVEVDLDDCEAWTTSPMSSAMSRATVRLLVVEQDDEYVALARVDAGDDEAHVFLSDGHAADAYPLAALIAEGVGAIADPTSPTRSTTSWRATCWPQPP